MIIHAFRKRDPEVPGIRIDWTCDMLGDPSEIRSIEQAKLLARAAAEALYADILDVTYYELGL